jgi:hypothetical protein
MPAKKKASLHDPVRLIPLLRRFNFAEGKHDKPESNQDPENGIAQ